MPAQVGVIFAVLLLFVVGHVASLGSIAHLYVADEVLKGLDENRPEISALIKNNWDAYAVGCDYPDTGYLPWADYGEITHWPPFVDAFLLYLNTTYPVRTPQRDALLSFVLGVCTHIQADITSHWTYYDLVALYDFKNLPNATAAWFTAHSYMDPATDWYVIVQKKIYDHATNWSVPVTDLLNVYKLMDHPEVTSLEIIRSNVIYYLVTGLDEDLVALPAYLYEKTFLIPWGMANLEHNDTDSMRYGAFPGQIYDSLEYVIDTWDTDQNYNTSISTRSSKARLAKFKKGNQRPLRRIFSKAKDLVMAEYELGAIKQWCDVDAMGNVEISKKCISSPF